MTGARPFAAMMSAALSDALAVVLPVDCAGCGMADIALCDDCLLALRPEVVVRVTASGLRVVSGVTFDGAAAGVIRTLKEDGRTRLARALAPALRAALQEALAAARAPYALVVPVPTSVAAYRRRGYRVPDLIAARAGVRMRRVLRWVRSTSDQRGLDRDERRRNVAGSLRATPVGDVPVIVLDDVVTTGATLDEAARALREAGARVLGAVTVAATTRRDSLTGHREETRDFRT